MLALSVQEGDYITIGDDIVIQIYAQKGKLTRIAIDAPREMPVVRSKLVEEQGATPECMKPVSYTHLFAKAICCR